MLALLPAIASAQTDWYGKKTEVDFKGDLLPKARLCNAEGCYKMKSTGVYGHSMVEQGLPTDHAALFGIWDGSNPPEEIPVEMCHCPDIRTVRVGPIYSEAGEWHWVNTSTFDSFGEAGVLLEYGTRIKAFVGHLVSAPEDVTKTEVISLPPLHPHHIHVTERALAPDGGWNYYQTDFHLWETHGDFSIGKTYGVGDRSNEGFQKHLPKGYSSPVHEGVKLWLYSVMNDMRTWNPKHIKMSAIDAAAAPKRTGHQGEVGQGITTMGEVSYEDAEKAAKDVAPVATPEEIFQAFVAADSDSDVKLTAAEFGNFITALLAIVSAAHEEWVADLGTDVSPEASIHGTGVIPYYLEAGFAVQYKEEDLATNKDVFAMGTRTPWPCDHMARAYKYNDAFYRVGQPNYPVVMFWTIVMPIAGVLINPIWIHSHHLRTWGGHVIVEGTLPNTPEFCEDVGIQMIDGVPHTDEWDFHKPKSLDYTWHKMLEIEGHPVLCKSDPTKATTIQAWTNAADGIKPGTRFDRATQIECIEGFSFPKYFHMTTAWFGVPLFEPEVEVIGQHMDGWFFIAPTEETVTDWDHGILRPVLDDCVNTCGAKAEMRATFPRDDSFGVKESNRNLFSMNFYAPYFYEKDFDIFKGPVPDPDGVRPLYGTIYEVPDSLKARASKAMRSTSFVVPAAVLTLAVLAAVAYRKMRAASATTEGEKVEILM